MTFDVNTFDVAKFDGILARGLSNGMGKRDGQMCIEAAICAALDLDHGDDPGCVAEAVRAFKIRLNDSAWSSPKARASGLRDLGLAQLGSLGVINDKEFAHRMAGKTIRVLIPKLFRHIFSGSEVLLKAAARCEAEGTRAAVIEARDGARAAAAAYAAADAAAYADAAAAYAAAAYAAAAAAYAAAYADAAYAAAADAAAADAAYAKRATKKADDAYLLLAASLALETLRELKSPGCALIEGRPAA